MWTERAVAEGAAAFHFPLIDDYAESFCWNEKTRKTKMKLMCRMERTMLQRWASKFPLLSARFPSCTLFPIIHLTPRHPTPARANSKPISSSCMILLTLAQ